MTSVTIKAIVDEGRQLHIALPDDMPLGPVEVTIKPVPEIVPGNELTREQARAILAAAGALSTMRFAPPDAQPLSDEEREEFGRLEPGAPSILELVDEGRGPR